MTVLGSTKSCPAEFGTKSNPVDFHSLLSLLPLHTLASGLKKSSLAMVRNTFIHYDTEEDEQGEIVKCRSNFLDGMPSRWSQEPTLVAHVEGLMQNYNIRDHEHSPHHDDIGKLPCDADSVAALDSCEVEETENSVDKQPHGRQRESEGSAGHAIGACKPCAWNYKPGGCGKSWACSFCHMCDEDAIKQKRKGKLERQKEGRRAVRARADTGVIQEMD